MAVARRRRVPEVLWRLFRNRARTLADTIVSIIPPSPSAADCRCKGRRCLGCSADNRTSFLLRPDDPSDYRKLLTQCFVVLSLNAPPLPPFSPDNRWSQHQILTRTIELIMSEQTVSSNVISSAYDKCNHSSPIVELLTCSAWDLLLRRVGDGTMVYLLKYSSIFLAVNRKRHCQVAGPPITDLSPKFSQCMSKSKNHRPSVVNTGFPKKRKKDCGEVSEKQAFCGSYGTDGPLSSVSCVGCNDRNHMWLLSRFSGQKPSHMSRAAMLSAESCNANCGDSSGKLQQCSNQTTGKSRSHLRMFSWQRCKRRRQLLTTESCTVDSGESCTELQQSSNQTAGKLKKRLRMFSWQRRKKRRHLSSGEAIVVNPDTTICVDKDSLSATFQCCLSTSLSHHHELISLLCPCCSFFQASFVNKRSQINRQLIFYNSECSSSVLPRKHILNSLKPNFAGANFLINDVFGFSDLSSQSMQCFHIKGFCLIRSSCLYHSFLNLLKTLILKAQDCQHQRLLDKHCSVTALDTNDNSKSEVNEFTSIQEGNLQVQKYHTKNCGQTLEVMDQHSEPSNSYCLKSQVVSFIWAVCRSIVPEDLLGTPSNWRILRRNISKFIQLRRYEKFSLKQCMHKLKASSFLLLSIKYSLCYGNNHVPNSGEQSGCGKLNVFTSSLKHDVLERWISWFFSCLVIPLLQANFYVTDSEHGRKDVFYYKKSTWGQLTNQAIMSMTDQDYCLLNATSIRSIIGNRSFGFSKLKLRPKGNGVRALANLKAPSRMPIRVCSLKDQTNGMLRNSQLLAKNVTYNHFKSVNCVLRDLHAVLKGLQLKEPEKLGSSVFDYNDVYRKLCPFVIGLKNRSGNLPGVFIVVSDVMKAFDSVDQDKLLSIMKDVIVKDDFLVKWSQQVLHFKKFSSVHGKLILVDQGSGSGRMGDVSTSFSHSSHSVLINQEQNRNVRKEKLYFTLEEHLKRNVLQINQHFYLQNVGIPQGSVLSSLLCSFYYGHLENNVIFPFLEKTWERSIGDLSRKYNHHHASASWNCENDIISSSEYILLRFIDDFLFISTSKKQAACFFSRLHRGFREYNCYMNEKKFSLNFECSHMSRFPSSRVYVGEDGVSFLQWSGLLINCSTLEVQADYTRYLKNHLSSTLTICWEGKPFDNLQKRLCAFMRPKCHPIFYDSNINSAAVVRLNIYQAFLLCAMKFHCYICELSNICGLDAGSYLYMIRKSLRYMHNLIKKRVFSIDCGSGLHPVLQLKKREVEWLGLNAYLRILKRKQSRHKELLSLLRTTLSECNKLLELSSSLKYAVNDLHSSVFWRIKY